MPVSGSGSLQALPPRWSRRSSTSTSQPSSLGGTLGDGEAEEARSRRRRGRRASGVRPVDGQRPVGCRPRRRGLRHRGGRARTGRRTGAGAGGRDRQVDGCLDRNGDREGAAVRTASHGRRHEPVATPNGDVAGCLTDGGEALRPQLPLQAQLRTQLAQTAACARRPRRRRGSARAASGRFTTRAPLAIIRVNTQ